MPEGELILLTGATGYVGRRLLQALERRGSRLRCLVRRPAALPGAAPSTEVVPGDLFDGESLRRAMVGITQAYYLVHSMSDEGGFAERDRQAALAFGGACRDAGVRVVELRAAVILGPGSLSFDLVRSLVDKLPVMVTPKWVRTPTQPIAIDDVIAYLQEALQVEPAGVYEIGGTDRTS